MPENYIDKIKKDGVEYEIHASNAGTKLYRHDIELNYQDALMCTLSIVCNVSTSFNLIDDVIGAFMNFGNGYAITENFDDGALLYISRTYLKYFDPNENINEIEFDEILIDIVTPL